MSPTAAHRSDMPTLKRILRLSTLGFCILVSACVSTESSRGAVNEEKALNAHVQLAGRYISRGEREMARNHILKALEIDSKSAGAHNAQALLFELEGELVEAEKHFKRAIRYDRKLISAQFNYGAFLSRHDRFEDCYEQLESVANNLSYTQRATAMALWGVCAQRINKPEKARAIFEHTVKLDPRQGSALIELAEISFVDKQYSTAKDFLTRYEASNPKSARSLWLGVRLERIFQNKNKAASYGLQLKNLHPYSKEYLQYKRLVAND